MKTLTFTIKDIVCEECSLALRRYLSGFAGVGSVEVEGRNVAVVFDQEKISRETVIDIARDSLEKLGHKLAA
ncbi:MAG TPA: heavy-metal-associated domain-containing protein [Nitrospirota bacterium]